MKKPGRAVVIGASAGGIEAVRNIVSNIGNALEAPIIVVQHFPSDSHMHLPTIFSRDVKLSLMEAADKAPVASGHIYFAPPGYHLLIEADQTFSYSVDEKINFSRPSIDVLFESASRVYQEGLIGIILTGANEDGAHGLKLVKDRGGIVIVQDPLTAEFPYMPRAALKKAEVGLVFSLKEISAFLLKEVGGYVE